MLSQISTGIAQLAINIDTMINRNRDEYAYTIVDIDESDEAKIQAAAKQIQTADNIIRVRTIKNTEAVSY